QGWMAPTETGSGSGSGSGTDFGAGGGAGAGDRGTVVGARGGARPSRDRRRAVRWIPVVIVLGLAVAVGYVAPLLVTIMVVAVVLVVAVGMRLGRERLPEGARTVP